MLSFHRYNWEWNLIVANFLSQILEKYHFAECIIFANGVVSKIKIKSIILLWYHFSEWGLYLQRRTSGAASFGWYFVVFGGNNSSPFAPDHFQVETRLLYFHITVAIDAIHSRCKQ